MADNKNAVPFLSYGYGQVDVAVRNGIADTNYSATAADTIVALTTLSAARTITLPAASSVPAGKQLIVKDESGSCSASNTITVVATIDGTSNRVLTAPYASIRVYSNGSAWCKVGA